MSVLYMLFIYQSETVGWIKRCESTFINTVLTYGYFRWIRPNGLNPPYFKVRQRRELIRARLGCKDYYLTFSKMINGKDFRNPLKGCWHSRKVSLVFCLINTPDVLTHTPASLLWPFEQGLLLLQYRCLIIRPRNQVP